MSGFTQFLKKDTKPRVDALRDDINARRNPNFFWPTGTQVYCGRQGSGKTVSAVKHLHDIKKRYPQAIIVSNIALTTYKAIDVSFGLENILAGMDKENDYIYFSTLDELAEVLTGVNNGFLGVIYVIDEIHTYFNALDSKNIPMWAFAEISQQRKQRKLIIGTSQLFMRMAKPLREQCDNIIICNTIGGIFTVQRAYDGMTIEQDYSGKLTGNHKKTGWFFHSRNLRKAFDTYQKVQSGNVQLEELQRLEIKEPKKKKLKLI